MNKESAKANFEARSDARIQELERKVAILTAACDFAIEYFEAFDGLDEYELSVLDTLNAAKAEGGAQ